MLALVPAGFLVLLLLGGIAVDSAVTVLGQRQLSDVTAAAANDAAGAALSDGAFYEGGLVAVDPSQAAEVACRDLAAQGDGDLHGVRLAVGVAGPVVAVEATATVDAVFGRAVPGFGTRQVQARSVAVAAAGPLAPRPPLAPVVVPISC